MLLRREREREEEEEEEEEDKEEEEARCLFPRTRRRRRRRGRTSNVQTTSLKIIIIIIIGNVIFTETKRGGGDERRRRETSRAAAAAGGGRRAFERCEGRRCVFCVRFRLRSGGFDDGTRDTKLVVPTKDTRVVLFDKNPNAMDGNLGGGFNINGGAAVLEKLGVYDEVFSENANKLRGRVIETVR